MMTPADYQALAMRTCGQVGSFNDMLLNAGLSLPEEAGEVLEIIFSSPEGYTIEAIGSELGDVCWYIAELCSALGWSLDDFVITPFHQFPLRATVDLLVIVTAKIAGLVKKYMFHQHELDREALDVYLHNVMDCVTMLCYIHRITLEAVMEANIAKLRKRYPHGFDPERSISRTNEEEE